MKKVCRAVLSAILLTLLMISSTSTASADELTDAGMVKDIIPGPDSSYPEYFYNAGGTLFFRGNDGIHGEELWKSDGTEAGTVMVKDINPGTGSTYLSWGADVGGTLYFQANDPTHGYELWKSDGTEAGTVMVKDINPDGSSNPVLLTDVAGTLFFTAYNGTTNHELWKSDGTEAGTVMVKDIIPGSSDAAISDRPAAVGNTLFFDTSDGIHGYELWKSDGTEDGTVMVKDINPGSGMSLPEDLTDVGGTLFFQGYDGTTHGQELWKSDGTEAGTVMVKDINPGVGGSSNYYYLADLDGTAFLSAHDATHGQELWKSDGTEAGTVMVKDINPDGSSEIILLTVVGGTLFFSADDGTHGFELWKSDGTEAGTVMVKDINPNGSETSYPQSLTDVGGTLFFVADDGIHGYELWKSDGTEAGTVMVKDIYPGTDTINPAHLTAVGETLFFRADDGTHGSELWMAFKYINEPPVAVDDMANTNENTYVYIDVLTNDTDADGDSLTVDSVTSPANGTAAINTDGTITYTPNADWNGTDSFTYTISDGNFTASASVTVRVNIPPVATDDKAATNEDNSVTIDVLDNDTDADGGTIIIISVTQPANGVVTYPSMGFFSDITYTPDLNFNGTDSFTYAIGDMQGGSDTATVTVKVLPVNNPLIITAFDPPSPVTMNEGGSQIFSVTISNVDGDTLTYSWAKDGSPIGTDSPSYTFQPGYTAAGTYNIKCEVSDGFVSVSQEWKVVVENVNRPPVITAITGSEVDEGETSTLSFSFTDLDDDDTHSAIIRWGDGTDKVIDPASSPVSATHLYTATGSYTVSVQVTDASGEDDSGATTCTVLHVNTPPDAVDDATTTDEDTPVTIDVLANDSDVDGGNLSVDSVTSPANGTADINPDGTITYTPNTNWNGTDSFTYTVSDGNGGTDTATVEVTVNPVNDSPVAADDAATTDEDTAVTIDVLANDSDVDGGNLSVDSVTSPANGTADINPDDTVTYTPNADWNGTDSFTYTVSDGNGGTDTATVEVTVNPVNDSPVAADDAATTNEDTAVTIDVLANDSDVDGGNLSVDSVTSPANGTADINPDDTVTYTPNADWNGTDSFTYTVGDANGGTDTATVEVTVNPVNEAPVVGPITAPIDPVQILDTVVASAGITDPNTDDTHTAVWDWGDGTTSSGTVIESNGAGSVGGNHEYSESGVYILTLTVTDNHGAEGTASYHYIVVYNPADGFVTGGGWIESPEGAYAADPLLTGQATFGFVSKYKKGATVPTGNTEFQFHTGNLNFHSSSYDWLVIAGKKAMYKGTGTINGEGNYGFMISAVDAALTPSTDVDLFRIKIWDKDTGEVVYDNQMGDEEDADATTEIGSGSIVIHKSK